MSNFDADGRNLGEATAINIPDAVRNLPTVMPGDDTGRADAIRKIREATGKVVPLKPQQNIATQDASPEVSDANDAPQIEVEEPEVTYSDAQEAVSKRSLKVDELDELVMDFDGEEIVLSKDDLKKGAGLYKANNKKAEELAHERKALEAEKAALAAKASNEVNDLQREIATRETRNSQIDEWLEYAYRNNYVSLKFPDGSQVQVAKLENERKANELAIRRSQTTASKKQQEIEESRRSFIESQRQILKAADPQIEDRLDDIASYLKRAGFTEDDANVLVNAKAELVLLLDKARKYDNALNSTPEKKKASQTKVISRGSSRSESPTTPQGNSNVAKWQEVVRSAPQGSSQYVEALRNIRKLQRA